MQLLQGYAISSPHFIENKIINKQILKKKRATPEKPPKQNTVPTTQWVFSSKKKRPVNENEAIWFKVTFQMSNIKEIRIEVQTLEYKLVMVLSK